MFNVKVFGYIIKPTFKSMPQISIIKLSESKKRLICLNILHMELETLHAC